MEAWKKISMINPMRLSGLFSSDIIVLRYVQRFSTEFHEILKKLETVLSAEKYLTNVRYFLSLACVVINRRKLECLVDYFHETEHKTSKELSANISTKKRLNNLFEGKKNIALNWNFLTKGKLYRHKSVKKSEIKTHSFPLESLGAIVRVSQLCQLSRACAVSVTDELPPLFLSSCPFSCSQSTDHHGRGSPFLAYNGGPIVLGQWYWTILGQYNQQVLDPYPVPVVL